MLKWFRKKFSSDRQVCLTLVRVQSGQSPAVADLGWEERWQVGDYWYCTQTDRLYKKVGEDFLCQKTSSLDELIKEGR